MEYNEDNYIYNDFIGIDVSKDTIDIYSTASSAHFTADNNSKSIQRVISRMKTDYSKTLVILENTGGYENVCICLLLEKNIAFHRTNNNKVKGYMRSLGQKVKTDKIDAMLLAKYGMERSRTLKLYQKPRKECEQIREFTVYLDELKRTRASHKNRLKSPNCSNIKPHVIAIIQMLDQSIDKLTNELKSIITADNEFKKKVELMSEYVGVGQQSAIQILACLPEIGVAGRREIAALSGLAPIVQNSGKKRRHNSISAGGRGIVRRTVFMVAMSAIVHNKNISQHYQKLISDGKQKMVALVACMRKIITQLNAIVRDGFEAKTAVLFV